MKRVVLAALSLLHFATSQPHGRQDVHRREVTTPRVVVWVDHSGQTVIIETQTPAAASAAATTATLSAQQSTVVVDSATTPAANPDASYDYEASAEDSSASSSGLGICYSPFNPDGSCKSAEQVSADISFLSDQEFKAVRTYGVECDQIATVNHAAQENNMTVFAGLLTISDVVGELTSMLEQVVASGSESLAASAITTISIGNELVDTGRAGPEDIIAALAITRTFFSTHAPDFTGAIVTVDTFNAIIQYPELCWHSDFCAANAHAFFDPTILPEQAGDWLRRQARRIRHAIRTYDRDHHHHHHHHQERDGDGEPQNRTNKRIVITETGWPHASTDSHADVAIDVDIAPRDQHSYGIGPPTPQNQRLAVDSLKRAAAVVEEDLDDGVVVERRVDDDGDDDDDDDDNFFITQLFLFTAFDDAWKEDGSWGVEKFWGILSSS